MEGIPEIVLTGGPCGGKTTGKIYLEEKLAAAGYRVFSVPESATMVILGGARDVVDIFKKDRALSRHIEEAIIRCHIDLRRNFQNLARGFPDAKKVILYDRGEMDAKAYMDDGMFKEIMRSIGAGICELRDTYEGVIHLRTAALGAEAAFEANRKNNPARFETLAEARLADALTENAWKGHPHLRIVGNATDFEGKMEKAFRIVCRMIGEPVPVEIEKKFLPHLVDLDHPTLRGAVKVEVEQAYLCSPPHTTYRIRKRSQGSSSVYYQTKKEKIGLGKHYETERFISAREYASLMLLRDPVRKIIKKDRYHFVYKDQCFELDILREPVSLAMLELELTNDNDAVELPPFLDIEREVTGDPKFSNSAIAAGSIAP